MLTFQSGIHFGVGLSKSRKFLNFILHWNLHAIKMYHNVLIWSVVIPWP